MTPRILITGGSGQLGGALAPRMQPLGDVLTPSSSQLDLSQPESLPAVLDTLQPDLILNCGAYTAVDRAEEEQALAHTINGEAPGVLARWAAEHGAGSFKSPQIMSLMARGLPLTQRICPPPPLMRMGPANSPANAQYWPLIREPSSSAWPGSTITGEPTFFEPCSDWQRPGTISPSSPINGVPLPHAMPWPPPSSHSPNRL